MTTHEDGRLRALAEDGRWPELLASYRQGRAAAVVEAGEEAAAVLTAPLGHLIAYAAPPELAVRLFDGDGGAGTAAGVADHDAGPLWEVLATRHSWSRLAPLLGPAPVRRLVAHTRALLGEDLSHGSEPYRSESHRSEPCGSGPYGPEPDPEGVPLRLEPWEASGWDEAARVREYLPGGGARSALLTLPASREGLGEVELPRAAESAGRPDGPRVARALAGLGALVPWAATACVRGPAPAAAALLARDRRVVGGYLPFPLAYPALVRAAAVGREQGCAHGRLALWRALAAMAAMDGADRTDGADGVGTRERAAGTAGTRGVDRAAVNALVVRMRCFTWQEPSAGLHHLHVALEDPASGVAWVVSGSQEL
ncbi:hypothetical protein ACGF0D_03965 [Kitasatospora sp. NPDC048298]|uniref:hypothetical protein n=1 Tax=Kitasatospora sp. NPDC048298 TaxID=3364049 RepID=UPI0037109D75